MMSENDCWIKSACLQPLAKGLDRWWWLDMDR